MRQMLAGDGTQVGHGTAKSRPAAAAHDVLAHDAVPGENILGQVDLPAPGMPRESAQQSRQRIGDACMPRGIGGARIPAGQHDRGEADQARRRLAAIALEVVQGRDRIVVEVEHPCVDEVDERLPRQTEGHDRVVQSRRDRVGAHVAARLALQRVAPPLQPDLAEHGLANGIAHAGDLEAEGVKGEEIWALVGRGEQRAQ